MSTQIATAKTLAKYFQESVSFNFKKETISSYRQIDKLHEEFYPLVVRNAFFALLNDFIGQDNQLVDIFMDLFDAGLGIHKFAEQFARSAPRGIVQSFLGQARYAYHKADVSKVYVAINTWLLFFGEKEISANWEICPFCGNAVANDVCTNKSCKKNKKAFDNALETLVKMLHSESNNQETTDPAFWSAITSKGEFYSQYVLPIEKLRRDRANAAESERIKQRQQIVAKAIALVNDYSNKVDLESTKDNPQYDALWDEMARLDTFIEGMSCNDVTLKQKIDDLRKKIQQKKKALKDAQNKQTAAEKFDKAVSRFVEVVDILQKEMADAVKPVDELVSLLAEADASLMIISQGQKNGFSISNKDAVALIDRYNKTLRASLVDFLQDYAYRDTIKTQQELLVARVSQFLTILDGVTPGDDKGGEIDKKFQNEIQSSADFGTFRTDRKAEYEQIVQPVKDRLAKLILQENQYKLDAFTKEMDALLKEIEKALPKEEKYNQLNERFLNITKNAHYQSIRNHVEYTNKVNVVKQKLMQLNSEENTYRVELAQTNEQLAKTKKRNKIITLVVSALCLVLLVTWSLVELAGVTNNPLLFYKANREVEFTEQNNALIVTGNNSSTEEVIIPEQSRLPWGLNKYFVTTIGKNAFADEDKVQRVTLPSTIRTIGNNAFANCENLKSVRLLSSKPPYIEENSFDKTNAVFYVPVDNYTAYVTDVQWSVFAERIFPDYNNSKTQGTILVDTLGGSVVDSVKQYQFNNTFPTLTQPTKHGYTFNGWYYLQEGAKAYVDNQTIFTQSVKLYADWIIGQYKMTFNYNGGVGEVLDKLVDFDSRIGELPQPKRDGYTFDGWYMDGTKIAPNDMVSFSTDVTAVAQWKANSYVVSFDLVGGEVALPEGSPTTKTVTFDTNYGYLPTPTRDGYVFSGWLLDEQQITSQTALTTPNDHVLTANWTPTPTMLYLVFNNQTVGPFEGWTGRAIELSDKFYGNDFTYRGYTLSGWTTDVNADKPDYLVGNEYIMGANDSYTLYATWVRDTYVINYYLDGGKNATQNPTSYHVESQTITFENPTREGYAFVEWSTDSSFTNPNNVVTQIESGSIGELNLYARWEANQNNIVFDGNGGIGEMPNQVVATDETVNLNTHEFTRTGYTFIGWGMDDKSATYVENDVYTMGATSTVTLYAIWSLDTYQIIYNLNGGANDSTNPTTHNVESEDIVFANPTKQGYTFIGWFENADLVSLPITGIEQGRTGNITLYAKWKANSYTINFHANGGDGTMPSISGLTNQEIVLSSNTYTKQNYKFVGWGTDSTSNLPTFANNEQITYDSPSDGQVVNLYAIWKQTDFVIYYHINGGEHSQSPTVEFDIDDNVIELSTATQMGYTFGGWYTNSQFTGDVISEIVPSQAVADYHLYAKWTANKYVAAYDYNGGSTGASYTELTYDNVYGSLPATSRVGYTFEGWFIKDTQTRVYDDTVVKVTNHITLQAKWTANIYTVSLNVNGGTPSGSVNSRNIAFDEDYGVLPSVSRVGYTFGGWYIDGNFNDANAIVSDTSTVRTAKDHILYAKWTANTYNVTFYFGYMFPEVTMKVTYDQPYGTLPTEKMTGYDFLGWTIDGSYIYADSIVKITSNKTATAVWNIHKHTLTISENNCKLTVRYSNSNGSKISSGTQIPYGTLIWVGCEPAADKYNNDKWWISSDNKRGSDGTFTMPDKNTTINSEADSCLAKGTQILLMDGTTIAVENVKSGDVIAAFDHATGKIVASTVAFTYYAVGYSNVIDMYFSNGTQLTFINKGHGLYNATLGKYVLVGPDNVGEFVGHQFVMTDGQSYQTVTLENCLVTMQFVERYDIVTSNNLNHIANGMLACSDTLVGVCNIFDFTQDFTYDVEQMQQDIETYGLYEYEDWAEYLTYEEFVTFNGAYFKIAVGKGLLTEEELFALLADLEEFNS